MCVSIQDVKRYLLYVILVALVSLFIFWAPFLLHVDKFWGIKFDRSGMDSIVSNFDGINFLVVEKSWYDPAKITEINRSFLTGNDPVYFSAHYPVYAGVIWVFDQFMSGPNAVLASIVVSNVLLAFGLFMFFREVFKKDYVAFVLSLVALFYPARMLSVRSVGSTEPIFLFLVLSSLVFAMRKKHWIAGLFGALAVLTRGPGILLFAGYLIMYVVQYRKDVVNGFKSIVPYLQIPFALVGLWLFYGFRYGSFLAYFQSGDNIHLFFPPFQALSNIQSWTSGMWLEDVVYIYVIFSIGLYLAWKMIKSRRSLLPLVSYGAIYMLMVFFVSHRDLARYSLPIVPLVLVGYGKDIVKSNIKWILLGLVVPVYLLGWNFVLNNIQAVNDWGVFL